MIPLDSLRDEVVRRGASDERSALIGAIAVIELMARQGICYECAGFWRLEDLRREVEHRV